MGLLKAVKGAGGGVLADQWREYFYCNSLSDNVLAAKGQKRTDGRRSSNTKGTDNVISNGSIIAVNEGQCMMIVQQGAIVEFCGEAGEFVWDNSTEPTVFYGDFADSLGESFKTFVKRFTMGGDAGVDQRVYFFNTKEIIGNKYGTAAPVPFRVVDRNIGLDVDIAIRCNGEFSYKLVDPILFYKNVCGNVEQSYTRDRIDSIMRTDVMTALQPAFAKISEMGIRYSSLPQHTTEICQSLNEVMSEKWAQFRGISVVDFGINSLKASEEDEALIKNAQMAAIYRDPTMAAAKLASSQADAMIAAAKNEGAGPVMAFAGMNMAAGAGGMNAANLYGIGAQQNAAAASEGWTCSCGAKGNKGKFCAECGKPRVTGWDCECGAKGNMGKFCAECGKKKPDGVPQYKCDKCGWEPEDPAHPPKFCPECGDPFGDEDKK